MASPCGHTSLKLLRTYTRSNRGFLVRHLIGVGTPRGLRGRRHAVVAAVSALTVSGDKWLCSRATAAPRTRKERSVPVDRRSTSLSPDAALCLCARE